MTYQGMIRQARRILLRGVGTVLGLTIVSLLFISAPEFDTIGSRGASVTIIALMALATVLALIYCHRRIRNRLVRDEARRVAQQTQIKAAAAAAAAAADRRHRRGPRGTTVFLIGVGGALSIGHLASRLSTIYLRGKK